MIKNHIATCDSGLLEYCDEFKRSDMNSAIIRPMSVATTMF